VQILGATHAGVAAYLLGLWGLPATIVEAVAFHHTPARSQTHGFGPMAAVYIANALEHELSEMRPGTAPTKLDRAFNYSSRITPP
jgi:HD-like signal output (HDOD) protein